MSPSITIQVDPECLSNNLARLAAIDVKMGRLEARTALEPWLRHSPCCGLPDGGSCSCGLLEAIRGLALMGILLLVGMVGCDNTPVMPPSPPPVVQLQTRPSVSFQPAEAPTFKLPKDVYFEAFMVTPEIWATDSGPGYSARQVVCQRYFFTTTTDLPDGHYAGTHTLRDSLGKPLLIVVDPPSKEVTRG